MRPAVSTVTSLESTQHHEGVESELVWLDLEELEADEAPVRELPPDVAQIIRTTADHLEMLDPYSLMGVEQDAEWTEIERAYRQRLSMFHPNRWSGYHLGDLRPSMERVAMRITFAFAFLAEEAAREGSLSGSGELSRDRPTRPVDLDASDVDLSGDRPTFPSSIAQALIEAIDAPPHARPPRPPPRKST